MAEYPWYELVKATNDILQGEVVDNCPIVIPSPEMDDSGKAEIEVKVTTYCHPKSN